MTRWSYRLARQILPDIINKLRANNSIGIKTLSRHYELYQDKLIFTTILDILLTKYKEPAFMLYF